MIVFVGEFVSGETGETRALNDIPMTEAIRWVRSASDGDALVLNAKKVRGEYVGPSQSFRSGPMISDRYTQDGTW